VPPTDVATELVHHQETVVFAPLLRGGA